MKGAFKNFPAHLQPDDISIDDVDAIARAVRSEFCPYGTLNIPANYKARMLQQGKTTTGDLDVLIRPFEPDWKDQIRKRSDVVVAISNGPQLMCVVTNLIDNDKQYFIDLIVTSDVGVSSHSFYLEFGTAMPAILGVFARSLGYKFTQAGLSLRLRDDKGNYHNVMIATSLSDILDILMLDKQVVLTKSESLYSALGVAKWIAASPRFDAAKWKKKPTEDDRAVNINRNAKRAVVSKPEIAGAFAYLDAVTQRSQIQNVDYQIERSVVGDSIVDNALKALNAQADRAKSLISGSDLIKLGITPGPVMGSILKTINQEFAVDQLTDQQLNSPQLKQQAIARALQLK